jgi:hypothetical protein
MWWQSIVDFRSEDKQEWIWLQVEWLKQYIDLTCGKPLCGYYVGVSEEGMVDEIAVDVIQDDKDGRKAGGLAVFYDDGAYEDYEPYFNKCYVAVEKFNNVVSWDNLDPIALKLFFEKYEYGEFLTKTSNDKDETKTAASWATLLSNCERIGVLPPNLAKKGSEWSWFILKLIGSYIKVACGEPPNGCNIKYIHEYEEGYIKDNYKRWRKPIGIGLNWFERKEDAFVAYLEKCRIAYGKVFSSIDWQAIDGFELRDYFEANGYEQYLDKY